MNICFVLPGFSQRPCGGYKMVYEYANRLSERGFNVTILFSYYGTSKKRLKNKIKAILLYIKYFHKMRPEWFNLNSKVKTISELDYKSVLNSDIVVATAIETVKVVKKLFPNSKKLYFIQGYENWSVSDEIVCESYKEGFENIVISSWLKKIVDKYSLKPSIYIPNALDDKIYKEIVKIEDRPKYSISVLYHESDHKGFKYAFQAIEKLKIKYPELHVEMFGAPDKPNWLPEYVHYKQKATQQETVDIYNSTSVYLCASLGEGWGLTGMEAMACGTALVSTDYESVYDYAQNGFNALLSPVKDVDGLVKNVSTLFDNDDMRVRIAKNGLKSMKNFSWDKSVDKFISVIENGC